MRPFNTSLFDPRTPNTTTPSANAKRDDPLDLAVGDEVNVPGEMHGTVKFLGNVRGKSGVFVGVELAERFAARGKNDGDVDGVSYFRTSVPGAGIFLPVHRAERRWSPALSLDSFPGTPGTPSYGTVNGARATPGQQRGITPQSTSKFAQTIGPGARPSSPQFKPKRPSLPRPESPLRRNQPSLAPTPAGSRNFSQSVIGPNATGRTPGKSGSHANFKASTSTRPPQQQVAGRPYSRSSSRVGQNNLTGNSFSTEEEKTPVGLVNGSRKTTATTSFSQTMRSPSRLGSAGSATPSNANNSNTTSTNEEIQRLRRELADRDRRLEDQATSLAEMEFSVRELSAILPEGSPMKDRSLPITTPPVISPSESESETLTQLRQHLRDKNEKIAALTKEFDAHRADFRSTLDSLELAATETERVYEDQKADLQARVKDLRAEKAEFETVGMQLRGLEELVAELEEGLEEARRGEAEARGEVEFLRGEVERGRAELRREREDKNGEEMAGLERELGEREDEIRGLKVLVQGLSSGEGGGVGGAEMQKLRLELEGSERSREEMEAELEDLRAQIASTRANAAAAATTNGHIRNESYTSSSSKTRGQILKQTAQAGTNGIARTHGNGGEAQAGVFCEMCESPTHDTLNCKKFLRSSAASAQRIPGADNLQDESPGKENENGSEDRAEKAVQKVEEEDKWCALCERDGHLAFDCPEEQY